MHRQKQMEKELHQEFKGRLIIKRKAANSKWISEGRLQRESENCFMPRRTKLLVHGVGEGVDGGKISVGWPDTHAVDGLHPHYFSC